MKLIKSFLLVCLLFSANVFGATAPVQGKDFTIIDPPQAVDDPKRIEVLEFFYYGCPHCHELEPILENWLKKKPSDVEFRYMPTVFNNAALPLTKLFYTLDALGVVEKLQSPVYEAVHKTKLNLNDPNIAADWAAKHGVDKKKFMDTYNSFAVQTKTQRAVQITKNYRIEGTPTVVVDGKYVTSPSMTGSYERFTSVLDQLVARARAERIKKR